MKLSKGLVAILALSVILLGCVSQESHQEKSGTGSVTTKLSDIAKMIPIDYKDAMLIDCKQLKDTPLAKYMLIPQKLQTFLNVTDDQILYIGGKGTHSGNFWKSLVVLIGEFDMAKIKNALKNSKIVGTDKPLWKKTEYEGFDIWVGQRSDIPSVVILNDKTILMGSEKSLKMSIDTIKGKRKSVYDSKDIKDVIDKLPNGFIMFVQIHEGGKKTVTVSKNGELVQETRYEPNAVGISFVKVNSTVMRIVSVGKYENEELAKEASKNVKGLDKVKKYCYDVSVRQEGEFVVITADFPPKNLEVVFGTSVYT